jgi:hypothetical protein
LHQKQSKRRIHTVSWAVGHLLSVFAFFPLLGIYPARLVQHAMVIEDIINKVNEALPADIRAIGMRQKRRLVSRLSCTKPDVAVDVELKQDIVKMRCCLKI